MTGSAGQLRVPATFLINTPYLLPPTKEQHRIVAAIEQQFTRLDAVVETLQRDRTKLKHTRSAILKSAVEGRLTEAWRAEHPTSETASQLLQRILAARRAKWEAEQVAKMQAQGKTPKDDTWKEGYREPAGPDTENLPELPEEWCWATVEQVCDYIVDCLHSTPSFRESGFACIDTNNIKPGQIVYEKIRYVDEATFIERNRRMKPQKNDVLFSREGALLGIAVTVPADLEFCLGQRMMIFRINQSIEPQYYESILNSSIFRSQYAKEITGSASPHLNIEDIRKFSIPLSPQLEQQQIVAEVERRLSILSQSEAAIEANLKRAGRLRQSILQKAFSGRLVPQDPRDEPASVLLERIRQERARREQEEKLLGKERHMQRKIKKDATRKPLYELLVEAQKPLKPEDLFKRAELKPDAPEDIDEFCEEVREEAVVNKRINILRPDTTQVYLEAVKE